MSEIPYRVEKPWGYELHWAKTDRYVGKLIHINAGHALSLQYHNKKDEVIFVFAGRMDEGWSLLETAIATGRQARLEEHLAPGRPGVELEQGANPEQRGRRRPADDELDDRHDLKG